MCCAWSASLATPVAFEVGSTIPPTGNHPSATAKKVSRIIPSQKSGIE